MYLERLVIILIFLPLAVIVMRAERTERPRVLKTAALFGLAILCDLVGMLLEQFGLARSGVAYSIALLIAGISMIQLAGIFLFRVVLPRMGMSTPRILHDVLIIIGVLVWGLTRLYYDAKVDPASIFTGSAVLTAVIGFSLQDTLGNILAGLALQLDQSIKIGDWIELESMTGRVVETRWRQTSIETRNWETVVIPNSVLLKNKFMVLGRRQGQPVQQRQWLPFFVDFNVPPGHVIHAVEGALRTSDIHGVAREPAPCCFLVELAQNPARYAVCYWLTELGAMNPVNSDVRVHIYSALKRAGIALAIPSQNVLLSTDEARAVRSEQEVIQRIDALGRIDLFEGFTPEELRSLALRLKPTPFAKGDTIMKQGTEAHWLFILTDGTADVFIENENHERAKVAQLGPGSVLGEMGLMTGEPRTATVVAKTDCDSYRLDKESFQSLLASRRDVAEEISGLLAERRAGLEATRQNLDADAKAALAKSARTDMRQRIWQFFGLDD